MGNSYMNRFWLFAQLNDSDGAIHLHCEFPQNDWVTLSRFVECADELSGTRVRSAGGILEFKFSFTAEGQGEVQAKLPHPDDIAAFLHRMRPFVLQSEPTYLPSVCNILARRIAAPRIRSRLDRQKKIFQGERMRSIIQINANAVRLNSDEVLMKWLNAFEYHRDEDKRKELEDLHWLWPTEHSRALFLYLMLDKADAVSYVRWLIGMLRQDTSCGEATCPYAT
jgi:hypothetical protein